MDELTAALASSFQVSNIPNNPDAPHPRFSQYKIKQNIPDQQERRKRILEQQKKNRFDFLRHVRKLVDEEWQQEEREAEHQVAEEEMDVQAVNVHRYRKPGPKYKDQLMLSEWMVDVPENLVEDWVMVLCPVGKRTLVVSCRGTTTAYAKSGYQVNRFPSLLPSGNRRGTHGPNDYCVLDCLFSEIDRTYYVLDIMCWKGHPVYDSETDFRFYWLATKLSEVENLDKISRINPFRFVPLRNFPCDKQSVGQALSVPSHQQVDGLLFYHKKAHYTFGVTPLVVWLKPYMVSEMLSVAVPQNLLSQMPSDYTNIVNHVQQWKQGEKDREDKRKNGRRHRSRRQQGMDVTEADESVDSIADESLDSIADKAADSLADEPASSSVTNISLSTKSNAG